MARTILKVLMMILFAPILLAATLLLLFAKFIVLFSSGCLSILSVIFGFAAVLLTVIMLFGSKLEWDWYIFLGSWGAAWAFSPLGVPFFVNLLVDLLTQFKSWIVGKIYGFNIVTKDYTSID